MTWDRRQGRPDFDEGLDLFVVEAIEDLESESSRDWDAVDPATASLSVRDATADVLASLARVPASRVGHHPASWPPAAWEAPTVVGHHFIASPPVTGSGLNLVQSTVAS